MEKKVANFQDIWHDDTRMSVLFAPFRDRSLNPSSWDQKMSFWVQAISFECNNSQKCIVDIAWLQKKFTRQGKVPLCLEVVLDELLRCNKINKLTNRTNSPVKQKASWINWGYDTFLKTPVTWGMNYLSTNQTSDNKYIILDVLHKKCDKIVDDHYCGLYCDTTDSVIDYSQLWKKSQSLCENETEFDLILEELVKQKKIVVHHQNSQTLIKFANREDKTVKTVSKRDTDIYRLKKTRDMLSDRIDVLSADIDKLKQEALRLKKTSKTQALRCMRQKKILEKRIEKLTGSMDMLDNILDQVTHSVSDEMVVKALESGNSVLKTLTGKTSVDQVANVMDELSEVLEQQNEIQDQLSSGPSGLDVSKEELEAELDEIMKGEIENKGSELLIDDIISGFSDLHLPTVPSTHLVPETDRVQSPQNITRTSETPVTIPQTQLSPQRLNNITTDSQVKSPSTSSDISGTNSPQNIHKQSNLDENLTDVSMEGFDLSLELPDVPTFVPKVDKNKSQACLDS